MSLDRRGRAVHAIMSAVQLDDLSAHVQADARAARMRPIVGLLMFEAEELVEDAGSKSGGTPGPVSVTLIIDRLTRGHCHSTSTADWLTVMCLRRACT